MRFWVPDLLQDASAPVWSSVSVRLWFEMTENDLNAHIKRALLIFRSSGLERIRSLFMCGCADDY